MTRKKPYVPVTSGVSFQPAVLEFLDRTSYQEGCDRSALINRIVREHAATVGTPLPELDRQHIPRIRTIGRVI
jgi:hypothetical protein